MGEIAERRQLVGLEGHQVEDLARGLSDEHLYDRVEDRDSGAPPRPWEKKTART